MLENPQCTHTKDTNLVFILFYISKENNWSTETFPLKHVKKIISGTPTNDLCSVYTEVIEISKISSETLLDSSETNGT